MAHGLRQYWESRRDHIARAKHEGVVLIRSVGGRLQVATPYRRDFPARAKDLGGRWRPRTGIWSFPWSNRRSVLDLLREFYGTEALGSWADYKG